MKIKGAIFDLDGTLLDSMALWDQLGEEYLRRGGYIPLRNTAQVLRTMTLEQAASYLRQTYKMAKSPEEIIGELLQLIAENYRCHIPLKPGVQPLLAQLKERQVKMCIATATDHDLAQAALARLDVLHYFDFIVTCSQLRMGKDDPQFFGQVLERLGTPLGETVVFEDALHAVAGAKAAGLFVEAVYDISAHEDRAALQATADLYLNSFTDWRWI